MMTDALPEIGPQRSARRPANGHRASYAPRRRGAHQVPGARTALGHAYGGDSQFFSMWVVASTPR